MQESVDLMARKINTSVYTSLKAFVSQHGVTMAKSGSDAIEYLLWDDAK